MAQSHQLHVQTRWYDLLANGKKRFEGRLCDSEVTGIKPQDVITFVSEGRTPLTMRVIDLHTYSNFTDMLASDRLCLLLPGIQTLAEGLEIYRGFPGYAENEHRYGARVFELEISS